MKQLLIRFRSGFLIYASIALISISLGLLGSYFLCGSMRRQQEAAIQAHLLTEAMEFKNHYKNLNTLLSLGYQKLRSQEIVDIDSADTNRYSLYKARETLLEICSGMSGEDALPIQELMMYFTRSNLAVTTKTVYSLSNLAALYFQTKEESITNMLDEFLTSGLSQTISILENESNHFCLYLRRFTVLGSKECLVGMAVLANETFRFDSVYDGNVYIATANGHCFDQSGMLFQWPGYGLLDETPIGWTDEAGREYQVISVPVTPGYRLAIAIPQTVYNRNIHLVGILIMFITLGAGMILSLTLFHARRRYNRSMTQIGELLHLSSEDQYAHGLGKAEFDRICQSLTHLIHQNDNLAQQNAMVQKQVESSRALMRNSFILMFLQGRVEPDELDSMLCFYNMKTEYERYRVMLLQIDGCGLTIEETDSALQALFTAASSIMLDCACETCIVDSKTVGLLYMCNLAQKCETDDKVRQYAAHLTTVMREKHGVRISAGLGRSVRDIHSCHLAYHSARIVLICNTRSGLLGMNLSDTITDEDSQSLMNILHAVEAGNTEQCLTFFDAMFQPVDEDSNYTVRQRSNAIMLFNLLDDTVNGNTQLKKLFSRDDAFNQQLSQCITLDEILKLIRLMLERACQAIASSDENHSKLLINRAIQILQQRFTDPGLSQSEIADALGINAATLSTRFKSVVGVNMSAYLRALRIERAKQLLEDTALPLETVAEQTGFGSIKTMYRVFKTETGTTPGQYRMSNNS